MGSTVDVWPPCSAEELRRKAAESLSREIEWLVDRTVKLCHELKHGIEDCYALLAPIDPGSTLVMSTHRNEKVKGTITRVGTRIVKGTLSVQLATLPPHQITVSPSEPIHMAALDAVHNHLTQAIDLLGLTLSSSAPPPTASSLSSALTVLAESLSESASLLKGAPDTAGNNSHPPAAWTTSSCPAHHFSPPLPSSISFFLTLQDSSVVLWLRVLEPVGAPVNFGTKLGLAIGTVRRLEHDEMDAVFRYRPDGDGSSEPLGGLASAHRRLAAKGPIQDVYVREKVKMESADPNLISLYSKLGYLSIMLGQARHNLATVLGDDSE